MHVLYGKRHLLHVKCKDLANTSARTFTQQLACSSLMGQIDNSACHECRYAHVPGIFTKKHIEGWKDITQATRDAGATFFCQLWHVGRSSHAGTCTALHQHGLTPRCFFSFITPFAHPFCQTQSVLPASAECKTRPLAQSISPQLSAWSTMHQLVWPAAIFAISASFVNMHDPDSVQGHSMPFIIS